MADNDWQDGILLKAGLLLCCCCYRLLRAVLSSFLTAAERTGRQHLGLHLPHREQYLHGGRAEGERAIGLMASQLPLSIRSTLSLQYPYGNVKETYVTP